MYYNSMGEQIEHKAALLNTFLDIQLAGTTFPNPNYRIAHNFSKDYLYNYYVFEYVQSGKGFIETSDRRLTVSAGQTYFLNKLRYHHYGADSKDPYRKIFVVVHGSFADALVDAYNIKESVVLKKIDVSPIIYEIFDILNNRNGENNIDELAVCVLKLFQRVADRQTAKSATPDIAEIIKSYLDSNLDEKLTLNSISEALHVSKSHIERVFRDKYKQSPLKYFTQQKVQYACSLLLNTNYSLTAIADSLAFIDAKYLSKLIKSETGLSPSQYRKQ